MSTRKVVKRVLLGGSNKLEGDAKTGTFLLHQWSQSCGTEMESIDLPYLGVIKQPFDSLQQVIDVKWLGEESISAKAKGLL